MTFNTKENANALYLLFGLQFLLNICIKLDLHIWSRLHISKDLQLVNVLFDILPWNAYKINNLRNLQSIIMQIEIVCEKVAQNCIVSDLSIWSFWVFCLSLCSCFI